MNYAVIDAGGTVINILVWDGVAAYAPPAGCTVVQTDTAGVGWTYASGQFTNPEAGD